MNCTELDNHLHEFLDNELAPEKRNEVANHLATCRRCAVRVAEFERADRYLRAEEPVTPPAGFLQQVRRKIELEEKVAEPESTELRESFWQEVVHRFTFPLWVKIPLAAAAALVLVFLLFHTIQPHPNPIPAAYQLTKNEVDKAEQDKWADQAKAPTHAEVASKAEPKESAPGGLKDRPEDRDDVVAAMPAIERGNFTVEELAKPEVSKSGPAPEAQSIATAPHEPPAITPSKAAPDVVVGKAVPDESQVAPAMAKKTIQPPTSRAGVTVGGIASDMVTTTSVLAATAGIGTNASAPPAGIAPPAPVRVAKSGRKSPELLTKYETPSVTNLNQPRQSGWLDLSTRVFYVEFGKASVGGAFVRGHLDEKSKFIVTSTQVEGQLTELDTRTVSSRGTVGWLELSSRDFVPSRPGLKPSYPYIEGYQDKQGEFHPTSRRIYQAGN